MHEAIEAFEGSSLAREAFGDVVVDHYLNMAWVEQHAYDAMGQRLGATPLLRAGLGSRYGGFWRVTTIRRSEPIVATAMDHRRAPLLDAIRRYQADGVVPFSTPGHKRGAGIDREFGEVVGSSFLSLDIPLGGGVDDTHFGGDTLAAAETLAAAAWGADRSFFLVNGSSAGNHAICSRR
jgi:hypothetical protein